MKLFKAGLRVYIAVFSVIGFFGGWILFAHAAKPAPAEPPPALSAPAPLKFPSLAPNNTSPSLQPLPSLPPFTRRVVPRLRTRGS